MTGWGLRFSQTLLKLNGRIDPQEKIFLRNDQIKQKMGDIVQHRVRIGRFHSSLKVHGGKYPQSYKSVARALDMVVLRRLISKEVKSFWFWACQTCLAFCKALGIFMHERKKDDIKDEQIFKMDEIPGNLQNRPIGHKLSKERTAKRKRYRRRNRGKGSIELMKKRRNTTKCTNNKMVYPEYAELSNRLRTYVEHTRRPFDDTVVQMAESGFYYTGRKDLVRCFQCEIGIRRWKSTHDPDVEHARWSPKCAFLVGSKGQEFVNGVQEAIANSLSQAEGTQDNGGLLSHIATNTHAVNPQSPCQHKLYLDGAVSGYTSPATLPSTSEPNNASPSRTIKLGRDKEQTMRTINLKLKHNNILREKHLCKNCHVRDVSVVFVPCGHLTCEKCAPDQETCHICKSVFSEKIDFKLDI